MTQRMSSARARATGLLTGLLMVLLACVPSGPVTTGKQDGPFPVALLVPAESGEAGDEVLARSLENAAKMAIADLPKEVQIELKIYSTRGDPEMAAYQAQQAVLAGARAILGPVFAQSAIAAGAAVKSRNVPVLSFSNNIDAAGGNVYILGPTFQNTASRLASYAASQGRNRAVIAYPDTPAGQAGANAFTRAIARSGGQIVAHTHYPLSQEDVISAASLISNTIGSTGASALYMTALPTEELPLLSQLLPEQGVNTEATKFIGLARWDITASTLSLQGLQGGWFALPSPARTTLFEDRYTAAFGSAPHPLAGLAYDGIHAIAALVAQGHTEVLTAQALTRPDGFKGVTGVFRFLPDGTNERALAVAEIRDNKVTVIDPAPEEFPRGGF